MLMLWKLTICAWLKLTTVIRHYEYQPAGVFISFPTLKMFSFFSFSFFLFLFLTTSLRRMRFQIFSNTSLLFSSFSSSSFFFFFFGGGGGGGGGSCFNVCSLVLIYIEHLSLVSFAGYSYHVALACFIFCHWSHDFAEYNAAQCTLT